MEGNTLIVFEAGKKGLHELSEQIASFLEGDFVQFSFIRLRHSCELVDRADGDILDEVFVKDHRGAIRCLLQALVEPGQEVFLDVDVGPTVAELLANVENGVSPKRSLKEGVLITN